LTSKLLSLEREKSAATTLEYIIRPPIYSSLSLRIHEIPVTSKNNYIEEMTATTLEYVVRPPIYSSLSLRIHDDVWTSPLIMKG